MDPVQRNPPPATKEARAAFAVSSAVPHLSTNHPPLPQFTLVHNHYLYCRYSEEAL